MLPHSEVKNEDLDALQPPPLPGVVVPPLPGVLPPPGGAAGFDGGDATGVGMGMNSGTGTVGGGAEGGLEGKLQRDLGVGVIWLVVLSAIARAVEPIHGYEIARSLSAAAPEGFRVKHGTLYPILRTMEGEGLVTSTLVASSEGPARKCFRITPVGRATLAAWVRAWGQTRQWVNHTLGETR